MYTLVNYLAAHAVGVAIAWWLLAPNSPALNAVTAAVVVLAGLWLYFVVGRRNRRLTSPHEDLTPHLITHAGFGWARWDRRSRRQDEPGGAETRAGNSV